MSWINGLFKKSPEKIVDGAVSGIDKLFFTNEEKAEINFKIAEALAEHAKETMSENSVRSYTRRILCVSVTAVYLLLIIACIVVYKFDIAYSAFIYKVADECLSTLVLMSFGFYVGAYMVKSYLNPKEWKKKNSQK